MHSRGPKGRYKNQNFSKDKHRINKNINSAEVMVVDSNGEQLGVMKTYKALQIAEDQGLDLVEVAAGAKPPVCRILDYGKLKYKEQKKAAETRKKTNTAEIKELRIRYSTDKHDLETKIKHARKFLEAGDKVRFQMRFRGRENVYQNLGVETFDKVIEELSDLADVEERTRLVNQRMLLSFIPKAKKV